MNVLAYTRTKDKSSANKFRHEVQSWCRANGHELEAFDADMLAGSRGLNGQLRVAAMSTSGIFVVDTLSDLGWDVASAVKQTEKLLDGLWTVIALATGMQLTSGTQYAEVITALAQAHARYVSDNRKTGIASAKAAGATIGRPATFTLARVRETIADLTDANKGQLPKTRDLANKVGCGRQRASELLREYKLETTTP